MFTEKRYWVGPLSYTADISCFLREKYQVLGSSNMGVADFETMNISWWQTFWKALGIADGFQGGWNLYCYGLHVCVAPPPSLFVEILIPKGEWY